MKIFIYCLFIFNFILFGFIDCLGENDKGKYFDPNYSPLIEFEIDRFGFFHEKNQISRRLSAHNSYIDDSKEFISLRRCSDAFEAYSASYLITREHLVYQFTGYNLSFVNCEMGTFIMTRQKSDAFKNINGSIVQSKDVLDFSVIHLSAFERLYNRWASVNNDVKQNKNNMTAVIEATSLLYNVSLLTRKQSKDFRFNYQQQLDDTVVIMPYLGNTMGAGHSKLLNRQYYLAACFWSFYSYYKHVVVMVQSQKDYDYIRNSSGLPFYEVVYLNSLPKPGALPVGTVVETKRKLTSGEWNFKYVFFTESDQILMTRINKDIYSYLNKFPRNLVLPHRLMPYPESVIGSFHKREISRLGPFDWKEIQCCIPKQYCTNRDSWVHVSNHSVPVLNIYGFQVPLGNTNFLKEMYRFCELHSDDSVPCD